MEKYDLGIIGGGPAGYSAALYALSLGKKVVLFEKDLMGGTCLNRGCIPTKAFIHIADTFAGIKSFDKLGINAENISFDFQKAVEYKNSVVSKLRRGLELSLKGVTIINSSAEIASKNVIKTNDDEFECSEIIIATGSKPKEIKGLEFDHEFILSSDDILTLDKLPKSILIAGSGAIGIEWARIMSNFGADVTIVELADRLCPVADWEISKRIERQFKTKKIKILTSASVDKIENKKVYLSNGDILEPEIVLVAVGREVVSPANSYGAKVIGDAASEIMLAHYAVSQAKNIVLDIPYNKDIVPSVIYGTPEIAWAGKVCKSKEEETEYDVSVFPVSALGKAHCDDSIDGFIKIIAKDGLIKGASIVSNEASALLQQLVVAMENNISVDRLKSICYPHPTYSEGIMECLMKI